MVQVYLVGAGDPDSTTEKLIAYEFGYRNRPTDSIEIDASAFYFDFKDFVTGNVRIEDIAFVLDPFPHMELPVTAFNDATAEYYGGEISVLWEASDRMRFTTWYAFVRLHANDVFNTTEEGTDPRHHASLRASFDVSPNVELDLWTRYVDNRPALGIESYIDLDVRLAWRPTDALTFSIVGQNLLDADRFEGITTPFYPGVVTAVEQSFYFQLTYRY